MTDEQILELAGRIFSKTWEHSMIEECEDEWFYKAGESKLLKFAQEIRKQTIDEILTTLEEVPNPEANRTAINRIRDI